VLTAACGGLHLGSGKPRQLGVLVPDDGAGPRWDAFQAGLRDLGSTESQNVVSTKRAAAPPDAQLYTLDVRKMDRLPDAFAAATRWPAQALLVLPDYVFYVARALLAQLTAEHHLPALYTAREYAAAGGLLSYGANLSDLYCRAATFIDRILSGARPGVLPVEPPSTFELVANLRAPQQLDLSFPSAILLQATVVR
jgi:putative ABC transport system substrate-binding protein